MKIFNAIMVFVFIGVPAALFWIDCWTNSVPPQQKYPWEALRGGGKYVGFLLHNIWMALLAETTLPYYVIKMCNMQFV